MHTYSGNWDDFKIYLEGAEFDRARADAAERNVAEYGSLEERLRLLSYYKENDSTEKWLPHACWMISNKPLDWVSDHMGIPTIHDRTQQQELLDAVIARVNRFSSNSAVLGGASDFVFNLDWHKSLTWMRQAAELAYPHPHWINRLFYTYLQLAKEDRNDAADFYELACRQAEEVLSVQDNESELCEMLFCLAEHSLSIGEHERAGTYASKGFSLVKEYEMLLYEHTRFQVLLDSIPSS